MRLSEVEMIKLLPSWMAQDGADRGLAAGCDTLSRDAFARLKLLSRWDKIDQLSEAELDEMAWELNIQWYDSTAPIETKRAVIRNSDRVYAKLGTPYAVAQIIADYFGTGEVRETNTKDIDGIALKPGEELTEETLDELSNGKGDDDHE